MFGLSGAGLRSIALLGAHCDDIAIGMGATLFGLCRAHPGLDVHAVVLTGEGTPRAEEEAAALAALTPGARLSLEVAGFPDGRTPDHWSAVKRTLREFAADISPQLVFGPHRRDAHQDHRQLAELIANEFRDQMAFGYEIVKWENDLPHPTTLVPVDETAMSAKIDALFTHYPSQRAHDWFDEEAFRGLARIRGISARTRYAEAFVVDPVIADLTRTDRDPIDPDHEESPAP